VFEVIAAGFWNNLRSMIAVTRRAGEAFRDHPHFSIFPGESVEIMECVPIPGQ
jgi:hypothetical protein